MSEDVPSAFSAFVAARSAAVISAAIADLSDPPTAELAHALHRHSGTLASFGIPGAERVARLDAGLRAGRDEASVRHDLTEVVSCLVSLLPEGEPPREDTW